MRRSFLLSAVLAAALLGGGWAAAQGSGEPSLAEARREAAEAKRRSEELERQAARATGEAERANAEAAALAARIGAAEAAITEAETRLRLIERLRLRQRARLAEQQGPLIRLTAALQTMARRPPALALVQPGSVDEVVRVRALLAASLPAIRARTAAVRAEIARGNALRLQADRAVAQLRSGREDLQRRRLALARFEQNQRTRSESFRQSALLESERALAFGEEARELARLAGTRDFQARLARRLAELPPPVPRPGGEAAVPPPRYILPVAGRLVVGTGEISDAGVHARGLVFETRAGAPVVAPRAGKIVYARPFGSYGRIVIVDHGGGWMTTITDLAAIDVAEGAQVRAGRRLGRAGPGRSRIGVELRHAGRPVPIPLLL